MAKIPITIRDLLWMTVVIALVLVFVWQRVHLNAEWEKIRIERAKTNSGWRQMKEFAALFGYEPHTASPDLINPPK